MKSFNSEHIGDIAKEIGFDLDGFDSRRHRIKDILNTRCDVEPFSAEGIPHHEVDIVYNKYILSLEGGIRELADVARAVAQELAERQPLVDFMNWSAEQKGMSWNPFEKVGINCRDVRASIDGKVEKIVSLKHEQTSRSLRLAMNDFYGLSSFWFNRLNDMVSDANSSLLTHFRLLMEVNPVKPVLDFDPAKKDVVLYIKSSFNYSPFFSLEELAKQGVNTARAVPSRRERVYFVTGNFNPLEIRFDEIKDVTELKLESDVDVAATLNIATFRKLHPNANVFYIRGNGLILPDMMLGYASRSILDFYSSDKKRMTPAGGTISHETTMQLGQRALLQFAGKPLIFPLVPNKMLLESSNVNCSRCNISSLCIDYEVKRRPINVSPFPDMLLKGLYLNRR